MIAGPPLVTTCYSMANPLSGAQRNSVFSHSSTEAKFHVVVYVMCKIDWFKSLLQDIGLQFPTTPIISIDNTSVVAHSENPIQHSKIKHVEIYLFFVREKVLSR